MSVMPEPAFSFPLYDDYGPTDVNTELKKLQSSPMAHVLVAGGLGGALGDTAMYPLDTVKTRQQGSILAKYRTMASATKAILGEEGIVRGVYRGYSAMLLGSFPSTMLFFGAYETFKRSVEPHIPAGWETGVHLAAGFLGDLASSVIYVPSEVLKARFQLQGPFNNKHFDSGYNYRGLSDAFRTIVNTEGPGAMFYGYKATLVRDLPFSGLQFAFYEKFRKSAQEQVGSRDIGLGLELGTGAAAGGLAGVITTPLDVIKTRIQTQTDGRIKSTLGGLRYIATHEGPLAVFSGVGPRLVWTSIQSSLMLVLYQTVLRFLEED